MNIDTFLSDAGMKAFELAEKVGITEASLSRIRRGQQNISRELIRRIVAATGGQVTVQDLVYPDAGAHEGPCPCCAQPGTEAA